MQEIHTYLIRQEHEQKKMPFVHDDYQLVVWSPRMSVWFHAVAYNKIQWTWLSSHILYYKKQKARQCRGNEATFMHHVQIFACIIFSACILSLFTFMKNASIEHWVCHCGKRKMTLKPLGKVSSTSSLLWLGLCLPICCTTASPGWQSLSLTLTVNTCC